jgi:hypothetical protein
VSLRAPNSAEVSYLNGVPVPYGTSGSIRADATVGPIAATLYAVDLKSGAAPNLSFQVVTYAGMDISELTEEPGSERLTLPSR